MEQELIDNKAREIALTLVGSDQNPEPVVDVESAEKTINQLMGNIPYEKGQSAKTHGNGPNFDLGKENDNLPVQQTETRENANSGKITGVAAALLEQNDF